MKFIDNVLSKIGYQRLSDGSHFYQLTKNGTSYLNAKDKVSIALTNPVIAACIEIRAKLLSQVEFYIEDENGEIVEDKDILSLLNNPNPLQSKQDFLKQYEWLKCAYGWVYQKPFKAVGFTADKIYNLDPFYIEFPDKLQSPLIWTKAEERDYFNQSFVYELENKKYTYKLNEIIPFYDLSNNLTHCTQSAITAPSRLDSIIKQATNISLAADAENVMIQTNGRELFSGGNAKGTGLGVSLAMDKDDKKNIENVLINKTGFGFGRKRAITTNQLIEWQSLHIKLSDLGLHDSITNNANIVRAAYEIPNELYKAFMKGDTFENQKEAFINTIQNVIKPIADDLANSWTSYFNLEGKKIKASFKHLPSMQHTENIKADKMLKIATAYEKLVRAGLTNEDVNDLFLAQGINITDEN